MKYRAKSTRPRGGPVHGWLHANELRTWKEFSRIPPREGMPRDAWGQSSFLAVQKGEGEEDWNWIPA